VDECECDTDDSAIHCHNKPAREHLKLPEKPLRGFSVLGLTNNNLKQLPTEAELLQSFPDLKVFFCFKDLKFICKTLPKKYDFNLNWESNCIILHNLNGK
jgi:hypothetical protein